MKKIWYPLLSVGLLAVSCDYLEKPKGTEITEETIFSTQNNIETFVTGTYYYGVVSDYTYLDSHNNGGGGYAPCCDEGEITMPWYWQHQWNNGAISASNIFDGKWNPGVGLKGNLHWLAIRRANTILAHMDNLTFTPTPGFVERVKGEAYWIRAWNYFELMRKYGGVPIMKEALDASDPESFKVPRSPLEDVVNFIVKDCDNAILMLEGRYDTYPDDQHGRVTTGAAYALKSRTLLYAASPQFNTGTPYMSLGANNNLICYGNYDPKRWELAAEAAQAAIEHCTTAGARALVNTGDPVEDYKSMWNDYATSELIIGEQPREEAGTYHVPWEPLTPAMCGGQGGVSVPLNFVALYDKATGEPSDWSFTEGGNDLLAKYAELEPRFHATMGYHTSYWSSEDPVLDLTEGGEHNNTDGACYGGCFVHKPVRYELTSSSPQIPNGMIFRLGELYLNLAEALNEAETGNMAPPEAYQAVKPIRERAGMPEYPSGLTKDEFRTLIRKERAIELAYENHRLWDLRRWLACEENGVMRGPMYGIKIHAIPDSDEFSYEPYVFEIRSFNKRMYLHPFSQNEINKGYLVQNPGY